MSDRFDFFSHLQMRLGKGNSIVVTREELADILPSYWREERVASPEEWFIRTGRGLGFHISHRIETGNFVVRKTESVADEATITWPGKDRVSP